MSKRVSGYLKRTPAEKLVVAIGAYGYDWPARGEAHEISFDRAIALARERGARVEWDAAAQSPSLTYRSGDGQHQVWFLDAPAAAAQLRALAMLPLRGTAIWRLGAEDAQLFDLFTRAPSPRRFDERLARAALARPLPGDSGVAIAGTGELFDVRSRPREGRRIVEWDRSGALRVQYAELPAGYAFARSGPRAGGRVALTFDDGPDPRWTPRILDVLRDRGRKATFFVVGENAQAHPDLVRRIVAEGHLLGNHTFTHPELHGVTALRTQLELRATSRLLDWLTGVHPVLFRPPFHGDASVADPLVAEALVRAADLGHRTLGHDVDPGDYAERDPRAIARKVLDGARSGTVILLHDGGGDRSATLAALPLIIDGLAARGIDLVGADELLGLPRAELLRPAHAAAADPVATSDAVVFGGAWLVGRLAAIAFFAALVLLASRTIALGVLAPLQARRARLDAQGQLSVSAVVPAYNEAKVIARTVESLLAQRPPLLEVLVVDDGSTDRTAEVVEERFAGDPRVHVVRKPNGGKASALNLGFCRARGEVVVALDGDTLFAPDTVARLCGPLADPRVAAVAGNAKVGNLVNRLTRWQALEYVTAQNLERRAWDLLGGVPVVPGAVGAWRRQAVLDAGGFHEDTLAEDTDLTLRLLADGARIAYADRALAFTEAPETARALLKQRFRWTYGVLQACWKHRARLLRPGSGALGCLVLPAFVLYQFAVPLFAPLVDLLFAAALLRGHVGATVAAYAAYLALDLAVSALAIGLEREDFGLLRSLPLQRVAHRYLLWAALVRSLWTAAAGIAVGWGKLARTGSVRPGASP